MGFALANPTIYLSYEARRSGVLNNNECCGSARQNEDIIIRRAAIEGSGNFCQLGSRYCTEHGQLALRLFSPIICRD